jgi:hypothetical protein
MFPGKPHDCGTRVGVAQLSIAVLIEFAGSGRRARSGYLW